MVGGMRIPVALAVSAVLALSACGGDDGEAKAEAYKKTSVEQVRKDAEKAMTGLESVRVDGTMSSQGQDISLDVALAKDGTCAGSMDVGEAGSFDVVVADEKGFVKADEKFWSTSLGPKGGAAAKKIGDKWVAANGGLEQLLSFCSFEGFVSGMAKSEKASWKDVSGTSDIDGESAVEVAFKAPDGQQGTAHVAAADPHYILQYDMGDQGQIGFSEFDEPVEAEAPASEDVVDLSKMG